MNKIQIFLIMLMLCACQNTFSYDLTGEISTRVNGAYSVLSMKEYNEYAAEKDIQKINSAWGITGDLIFNMSRDLALSLRGEYITGISSGDNNIYATMIMNPLLFGIVYRSAPVEYLSLVSCVYLGYSWANWEFKQKAATVSYITSGGCFTGEADLDVLWRMPFEERLSVGVTAGLRYANILSMTETGYSENQTTTRAAGVVVTNAQGEDVTFDMSGVKFGISFIYDF